uniref:DNA 3'-5' helicase n=1 Tax=Seriola lalandi dorsalis TaxID=1841481 RepID=A0A3B4XRS4_SERLL
QGKAKRRHLGPAECGELAAEGINALAHPHTLNRGRGNRDPNRGLYPTKRRKWEEIEDEVDDATLLAAGTLTEPEEVDYLEGMTAEMFGEDFDSCDSKFYKNEELVEELPDAHYGLLGSSGFLLQPQGCMDDLPEEVLWQVLCLLSAQDLYRSVIRVCHRWRNIVQDSKVTQTTELYQMTFLSAGVVRINIEVNLMAQHKVGERLWLRDKMTTVELEKRKVFTSFMSDLQGPNPYAAMAVILILSQSVGDVQALVSLLTGCMSHTAITEYLSHMAMMLLALQRSNIQISNRLHYNIYYVLHLMENEMGTCVCVCVSARWPQIQLTGEQQQILTHDIQEHHVVKIIAFAGTGKTTTLIKYAEQRPDLRFLYVAFNKSVAFEAARRFPRNVDCKTVHSLAFKDVGKRYHYRKKLTANLKAFTINAVLPDGRGGFTKAKVVTTTLNTFMASADQTITTRHVPSTHVTNNGFRKDIDDGEKRLFVHDAQTIWNKMKDLNETNKEAYSMTHDGYLKLWQLQNPKPRLSDKYDVLFIDEAQDCTPAIMDVLLSQRCGKILVGDPHQQIYTFKGAVNALQIVDHTHVFYLTQSFRFGAEIAYVGATILKVCKRVQKILAVRTGASPCRGKVAILARCNLSVFTIAVMLTDANPQCQIHFIGDVKNIGLGRIEDIWKLKEMAGKATPGPSNISDPLIRSFARKPQTAFWTLKKYATQTEDLELSAKLNIVEKYGSRIPELVTRLNSCSENNSHKADFIVGTVHKAKGLEFDTVMVTDDFTEVPCSRHNLHHHPGFAFCESKFPDDEWNLLYVAVTRARTSLIITKSIYNILTVAGEYFLKSEMPDSLMKAGEPLPCSITNCPNCITPGSAFIMCKQQMQYVRNKPIFECL